MAPSFALPVRRGATALACAALLGAAVAPAARADESPAPQQSGSAPAPAAGKRTGPYGAKDAKFDGVWRTSLAFLAQHAAGVTPAPEAIDWLAGQQCADGGFATYRADVKSPCDPEKGEFSDATGAAVQALVTVGGRGPVVAKGLEWLTKHQNADGGWGMNPGSPTDPNSTAVVIGAFTAADKEPGEVRSKDGKNPYDALLRFQLTCDAKQAERGAFGYQPDKAGKLAPNALATADGALAARGEGFLVEPVKAADNAAPKVLACGDGAKSAKDQQRGDDGPNEEPDGAAEAAAAYLATTLAAHGQHLTSALPGAEPQPDFGSTADAVIALAAGDHHAAATGALRWLQGSGNGALAWAKDDPGALAKLVLAAHAAGADPRDFAGANLVDQLGATGPTPSDVRADTSAADDAKDKKDDKDEKDDDGGGMGVWWIVGVGLVAGVGIGFLLSGRKKQQL